jgi:hypothetical protein
MKIVRINGGLGNQAFQYIFARYIETMTGEEVYLDNRELSFAYPGKPWVKYRLRDVFGVEMKLMSEVFTPDVWDYIIKETIHERNVSFPDLLVAEGVIPDLKVVQEGNHLEIVTRHYARPFKGTEYTVPMNQYLRWVNEVNGNVYYHGYWLNTEWFKRVKDIIYKDFTFPPFENDENGLYNSNFVKLIKKHRAQAVCVNVRRGDFVDLGWEIDLTFYRSATEAYRKEIGSPHWFLFSDDKTFCREHVRELGIDPDHEPCHYIEDNTGDYMFRDAHLMTQFKNTIMSNSSFSYLAALLNRTPGKRFINPTPFREII